MKYAIGIDVGGTYIKYALVCKETSEFLFHGKLPSFADKTAQDVMTQILEACSECQKYAEEHQLKISGIGIGTPGLVDEAAGIVLGGADNIKGWIDIHLKEYIEEHTNFPVVVGNDATLMAKGEVVYGAAKGLTDVVFITVGTGIGGALLINGAMYGGYRNRGTELGHIPLMLGGKPCTCGAEGCLEVYASTSALIDIYKDNLDKYSVTVEGEITGEHIVNQYLEGDDIAKETMHEHWYYLGRGIAAFVNIFSPQAVVVGGGIAESGDFYIKELSDYVNDFAMPDCRENTKIVRAALGNKAACLGAVATLFEYLEQ